MEYNFVDLGLPSGTLWMDRNIGASSPTDIGLYFACGETKGYTTDEVGKTKQFTWKDYKFSKRGTEFVSKYGANDKYNDSDCIFALENADDAAYKHTNGECVTPTREQIEELSDNTAMTIVDTFDGVILVSKINGNKLHIPFSGNVSYGKIEMGIPLFGERVSILMCNRTRIKFPFDCYCLYVTKDKCQLTRNLKCRGLNVRGVKNVNK